MEPRYTESAIEMTIRVPELIHFIIKKIPVIVAAALVFAVLGLVFSAITGGSSYTAITRICVIPFLDIEQTEAQFSTITMNDSKAIVTSESVAAAVIEKLELDMDPTDLTDSIELISTSNSRILQINVTNVSEELAVELANTVRTEATAQIKAVLPVEDVRLVNEATFATENTGSSGIFMAALAAVVGAFFAICVFVILFLTDKTVRTEEDVRDRLGLPVIAVIPESRSFGINSVSNKKRM